MVVYFLVHCLLNRQVGEQLPAVEVQEGEPGNKVAMDQLFKGKKGVLFAVPGAFTPGCSKVESVMSFFFFFCSLHTVTFADVVILWLLSDSPPGFCGAGQRVEGQRNTGGRLHFCQWRVCHGCLGKRARNRWQGMDYVVDTLTWF